MMTRRRWLTLLCGLPALPLVARERLLREWRLAGLQARMERLQRDFDAAFGRHALARVKAHGREVRRTLEVYVELEKALARIATL